MKYSKIKNIYLASDDYFVKKKIYKKLVNDKFNVFVNNAHFDPQEFRQTSLEDFFVDLYILSNSKLLISSAGGGVPLTAHLMSKQKLKLYNFNEFKNKYFILNIIAEFIFFLRKLVKK